MGKSTYVKLVAGSKQQSITLAEVKDLFQLYVDRMSKLSDQLDWEYKDAAFPYVIEEKPEGKDQWFFLKAVDPLYNYLVVGVDKEEVEGNTISYVQIVIPDEEHRMPGDVAKANEFAKYLARYLQAELHLFNDRIMYFNPRK